MNIYLSQGDCSDALETILPVYDSATSDNDLRMAMAQVYACEAGFNFFEFLSTAESQNFSNNDVLFELFAKEFPSSGTNIGDKIVESAGFGIDALMSIITPGIVLVPGDLFNTSTDNELAALHRQNLGFQRVHVLISRWRHWEVWKIESGHRPRRGADEFAAADLEYGLDDGNAKNGGRLERQWLRVCFGTGEFRGRDRGAFDDLPRQSSGDEYSVLSRQYAKHGRRQG